MPKKSSTSADEGYVYFIQAEHSKLIKIGHSIDPRRRLVSMATMTPEPLVLVAIQPGGRDMERSLHRRFYRARTHGEWFRPTAGVLAVIASAREQITPPEEFEMISAPVAEKLFYLSQTTLERLADEGLVTRFKSRGMSWFNESELIAYVEREHEARRLRREQDARRNDI